jgi:cation transport protein ChaC
LSTAKRGQTGAPDKADAEPPRRLFAELRRGAQEVWVFAYGSLIWEPDFAHTEALPALLRGWHRRCCLYSFDYRGTRTRPGLVLGLDRGGSCRGIAFRLAPERLAHSLDRLWRREMAPPPPVYEPRLLPIATRRGRRAALGFTVRRDRPDYAGRLPLDVAARLIALANGSRGSCRDYLEETLRHLAAYGIVDAPLRRLGERVATIANGVSGAAAANLSPRVGGDFLEQ